MKRDVIIIGGGISGLMCSYMLLKDGISSTIIDKGALEDKASFGNAGLLTSQRRAPLPNLKIIYKALRSNFKKKSLIRIYPSFDINLYRWVMKFLQSCPNSKIEHIKSLFEKYGELALNIYEYMSKVDNINFELNQDGIIQTFTNEKSLKEIYHIANKDKDGYHILNSNEIKEYAPLLNNNIKGAVMLKLNGRLNPEKLLQNTTKYLLKSGVEFIEDEEIIGLSFDKKNHKILKIVSKNTEYEADEFIIATGANLDFIKKINRKILLLEARGYNITFKMNDNLKPKTSIIFQDLKVAMSLREDNVRITGGFEIGTNIGKPNSLESKIQTMLDDLSPYIKKFKISEAKKWVGFRPAVPSDIPYLGRDEFYNNVTYAVGLGWLGITFAPAIGKIISTLVSKKQKNKDNEDLLAFSAFYN